MLISRRNLLAAAGIAGATAVLSSLDGPATAAGPLNLQLYTADQNGFLVNSVILTGEKEAVLIDTQFSLANAHRLAAELLNAGKRLTTVYITHPHPDHYFGIEVIKAAFPDAKVVAIAPVCAAIEASFAKKIAQWGPKLGANGPTKVSLPAVLDVPILDLEGHRIEVIGPVQGDASINTMLWIADLKAVVAGDTVYGRTHVWTASSDQSERTQWFKTLDRIEALTPAVVVPGHIQPGAPLDLSLVQHTRDYLKAFDQVAGSTRKADDEGEIRQS